MTTPFTGGAVTKDLTLSFGCSPYTITKDIVVNTNAVLTIEPGVVMKFAQGTGMTVGQYSAGKVVAEGISPLLGIVFTSASASPTAGDWEGISLAANTMAGTTFRNVTFNFCGSAGGACINADAGVKAGAVTLDGNTFDHVGASADAINVDGDGSKIPITNSVFKPGAIAAGRYAVSLPAPAVDMIKNNVFNGAPIEIRGGTVAATATWGNPSTPFVVTKDIVVEGTSSPVLTLSPGTVMRFASGMGLVVGRYAAGGLVAEGTALLPITMTSNQASPGAGDWSGILLDGNTANGTKLAYATVDYCGDADSACIVIDRVKSDRVTVDHVVINHVGGTADGISAVGDDVRAKITNMTFPAGAIQAGNFAISVNAPSFAAIGPSVFNTASIAITGGTLATGPVNWADPGTTLVVQKDLIVEGATTPVLTIGKGMTLKFVAGTGVVVGRYNAGKLVIAGAADAHVTLTSVAATPAAGDWDGVLIDNKGQGDISFADISYGGAAGGAGLYIDGAQPTVKVANTTLSNSAGYGLHMDCTAPKVTVEPTVTYATNADGDTNCP
jgi:hypothetical protein